MVINVTNVDGSQSINVSNQNVVAVPKITTELPDINIQAGYSPYIGENGNWFQYDDTVKTFIDTGIKAEGRNGDIGQTPNISIGTVEISDTPSIVTRGTPEEVILDFKLPLGPTGESFKLKGLFLDLDALCSVNPVGQVGDAYAVGTIFHNTIYIWDVQTTTWINIGPMYDTEHLESLLGITPLDGGDFFEEYYNLDVDGDNF